ncbi:hypothetical protein [Tsukamurella pseudospumae]|uniref:hypothetical protein n=1 Tax=Tsukamurella pseudospumae TaxID=239498 RepID=UPI001112C521|nr:hypothetical protein [Tsukamurella pseudospumae]
MREKMPCPWRRFERGTDSHSPFPVRIRSGSLTSTSAKDRQILADAAAAHATYLVTEDVDDFAPNDIHAAGLAAAVNPDLFLSRRVSHETYVAILDVICRGRTRYPQTPAQLHSALAANHPLLYAAHARAFAVDPATPIHRQSRVLFRGTRCLGCAGPLNDSARAAGLCEGCKQPD